MSDQFSWQDLEAQQNRERAEREATTKAKADDERRRQAALRQQGVDQRELIGERIIDPFLNAMRQRYNPGTRGFWNPRWSDGGNRKERHIPPYDGKIYYFDVYTNGSWLFGVRDGGLHTGREIYGGDSWVVSSKYTRSERDVILSDDIQTFQSLLLGILQKHRVPIPPDAK